MTATLTNDLVDRFESIRFDFYALADAGMKRSLILKHCQEMCDKYDARVAANAMNIIQHYASTEEVSIDALIQFLSLNRDLDFQTMLREEKDGFDKQYGTITSLILRQYELPENVSLHRFQTSGRCHPSPISSVKMALAALAGYDVQYDQFVFIDVGAGLGRNLLLAADYPFKKIIGIEHSQYLANLAKHNLELYQSKKQQTYPFEIICADAFEYQFPEDNIIFYFWRPFTEDIAADFFHTIEPLLRSGSFKILLVFLGPVYTVIRELAYLARLDIFFTPDLLDDENNFFTISVYSPRNSV